MPIGAPIYAQLCREYDTAARYAQTLQCQPWSKPHVRSRTGRALWQRKPPHMKLQQQNNCSAGRQAQQIVLVRIAPGLARLLSCLERCPSRTA